MTDLTSVTPRIVFYKYPKVNHSIRNITNEIDNRLKYINRKNETLEGICPIPKSKKSLFKDKHVLHLLLSKVKRQNIHRQSIKTHVTFNNSHSDYLHIETFKSPSNSKKPILKLMRNRTSLFKTEKTQSLFKSFIPTAFTEENQRTPIFKKEKTVSFPLTEQNCRKKAFKLPRPYSSINFNHQHVIDMCDRTIEEASKIHQSIVNQSQIEEQQMKKRSHSQAKSDLNHLHKEIPFEKVTKKYYIYHLGHFIPKNKGIKDNLINFQNISKISPSESYNMRNILGDEIGYTIDTKEDEINLIQKNKEREQYQKPKWIDISDKKGRIRFRDILKKTEKNKRELARVIEKIQLTGMNS